MQCFVVHYWFIILFEGAKDRKRSFARITICQHRIIPLSGSLNPSIQDLTSHMCVVYPREEAPCGVFQIIVLYISRQWLGAVRRLNINKMSNLWEYTSIAHEKQCFTPLYTYSPIDGQFCHLLLKSLDVLEKIPSPTPFLAALENLTYQTSCPHLFHMYSNR